MNQYADRRANAVAIVSPDPLLGALVGAAVEVLGYRAEFPREGEAAGAALRRVRPAYALIDCEDASARDETVLGRGLMSRTRVFLFGTAERTAQLRALAIKYEVELIVFPRDAELLHEILSRRIQTSDELLAERGRELHD